MFKRLVAILLFFVVSALFAQQPPDLLKGVQFRNIGPAIMGGRIDDFAVVESTPAVFYVAAASGGLWKTVNNGVTFEPVFEREAVSSIGDVTVAPSDPNIVYVGTGEPNNRQSSSWGNGVYKSLDGGKTWVHLGLNDTHHIGRMVVDPTNPDVVYVAAAGHLWGPNKERGLYKTTDGGKTWSNTKFINEDTGFIDVAMDPESPRILYAASYQRRRTPFGFNGGGPGSALWKTVDGGATWTKLGKGLPAEGNMGRIGVTVYRRDPRIVYAIIEHARQGGVYRSNDRGESWTRMSDTNPRPSYYSKIHIDPNNDQRVWVLGAPMYYSEDGGKTFRTDLVQKIHGDYHALWINPRDSNHMLAGTDGGIHISYDRGRSWDFLNTIPLAQYYEVGVDLRKPYFVYGGLQDNGSWAGPSRTLFSQGITNEDWFRVGGGDGFYVVVDPTDHNIVYAESQDGNVGRLDLRTGERRNIRPEPPEGQKYRFNWNSPILISLHDPKTIYYAGNRVFGSKDRGETWTLITPDLTSNVERDKLKIFGQETREMLSRNDGVVHYGTITALAESPLKAGILWAGTDDGNLQVSRDGSATWTNVAGRVPGVPKGTYVSRIEPSRAREGRVYVALDGHRGDDYRPYLFRTDDFGQTWQSVSGNIPDGQTIRVVREYPKNPDLLFVGSESELWISRNGGGRWERVRSNLPTTVVSDILIHPRDNDLVVATHAHGVWVLDDVTSLAQLSEEVQGANLHLFDIRPATQYRLYSHKGSTGHKFFAAPNPPEGALVDYWLKSRAGEKEEVKITISDASGKTVRELKGSKEAGINRANWDLRHEPPVEPEPGAPGFFGPSRGPLVPPGTYTVKLSLGSWSASKPVVVEEDSRIGISEAERRQWYQACLDSAALWKQTDAANRKMSALRRQLTELQSTLEKDRQASAAVTSEVKKLAARVEEVARRLTIQRPLGFAGAPLADEPEPLLSRVRGFYSTVGGYTAPPTPQHAALLERLKKQAAAVDGEVKTIVEKNVPALNRLLLDNGLGRLDAGRR